MGNLKKAAFLSYIKLAVTNIGGLLVTPYIIKMLGDEEYGLYTLIGAFVGYLSVLDLGLNNAIVRYVAQYRAEKDQKAEENFLALSLIIYIGIGLLLVILGAIFYVNIDNLFGDTLDAAQLEKARWMLLILIINIGFTLPGGAFTGICTGYEAFVFPRWLSIFKYVLRVILIIAILNFGANALGIVILDTLLNLGFILLTIWFVFSKLKVRIKLHRFEWLYLKEIFGYSIWIFIFGLVYQFQWRTGQVILGTHLSPVVVAVYGIGVMLGVYFTTFGNIINRLILPKAVQSVYNQANSQVLTAQMTKVARISLFLLLFIFGGFIVVGKDFIQLWVGSTYANAYYIGAGIMLVYIMPIAQGYAHSILEAKKLLRFKTMSFLIACVVGMIAGGILSYTYGELGMILGLLVPLFILQWVIMNLYYHKKLDLNIKCFFQKTLPLFLMSIVVIPLAYLLAQQFEITWTNFILKGFLFGLIFGVLLLLLLHKVEKKLLFKRFTI
ncbi:oligosaccharide flippase family protein [Haloflavibacter putidus]|uniref:Oligosaccharide flippase family protein n=1 Tax=Haloflavibacter putidus TaxID=2576776 RepID=A0A507ZIH0_9FLAO|nr:oligosaccharide flippase family protein [Haloflavibacter putidus]